MIEIVKEIGVPGFLDIAFVSILTYAVFIWFKKTKSALVLVGIFIVGTIYLLADHFNMVLTTSIFQGFFAVILVALVVIFQEELRHFFELVAVWSLDRRLMRKKVISSFSKEVQVLARTLTDLAKDHIGALVVIRGTDLIVRHLHGGTALNGDLSEPVLKSLFDPNSPGHDGAVVIEKNRIVQFSCHLPLSKDLKKLGQGSTRHAAALGLSELTDALCLVVSEERGVISVARSGDIEEVPDPEKLSLILQRFYNEILPPQEARPWESFFKTHFREKALAVLVAMVLWFFVGYASRVTYRTYHLPLRYGNLPENLEVVSLSQDSVEATFSAPHRNFYFLNPSKIRVRVNLFNAREGSFQRVLVKSDLHYPEGLEFESVEPNVVEIRVKAKALPASVP
ncbi:MAG: hypothetical protein A2636_00985 [Elusimicrobia bacterium RIFCSPHIGHO2_01_FULL_64_10]|nr:MAG: hypothetical protein A2636_00985 [Elusimicrobia bacterium RIFCSPHIGHO2_01_FULL_64_10]